MLNERKAVVTGAASGIGQAIAELMLERGAQVLLVDMNGDALVEAYPDTDPAFFLSIDLSEDNAAATVATKAEELFNAKLDILVNAAGISAMTPLEDISIADWSAVMDINLTAVFAISQSCRPLLIKSPYGRIINIGSVMSSFAGSGMAAYTASKHGVLGLTKVLATELGQHGVTANCIQPGAILTGITQELHDNDASFREFWNNKAAIGRWGTPQDIAYLAAFLASDEAAFISGHGIYCDGGAMQQV
ncbi:MAG: SDR family NAD(P)-dependent oxidoreductase [Pseudomonadales bacterium]